MTASVIRLPLAPAAVAAACQLASEHAAADIATGVQRERHRVMELVSIVKQADRLGVDVDIAAIIEYGASPNEVRAAVLEIAAGEGDTNDANT